jgi:hypothetical protein
MKSVKTVSEILNDLRHIKNLDRFDFIATVYREYGVDAVTGEVLFELLQASSPVQEPVALDQEREAFEEWYDRIFVKRGHAAHHRFSDRDAYCIDEIQNQWKGWKGRAKRTTQPAVLRQWVGLTEQEALDCFSPNPVTHSKNVEAKLKEKNA